MLNFAGFGAAIALCVLAAIWDVRTRHIPNFLTLGGIALGVALQAALSAVEEGVRGAIHGALWAVLGAAVCGAMPLVSFRKGDLGGGDVKLFAAVGALCGPAPGFHAEAWGYAVAFFVVLPLRLVTRGLLLASVRNVVTSVRNAFRPAAQRAAYESVPMRLVMGPWILTGVCIEALRAGVLR